MKMPSLFLIVVLLGCLVSCSKNEEEEPRRNIPLDAIYSTNGQEGLKPMNRAFLLEKDGTRKYLEPYGRSLCEIHGQFRAGGPDLFLVRGKDITAAAWATCLALLGSRSFNTPVDPEDGSTDSSLWLVAYLGTKGSEPPAWLLKSAEQKGKAIRLSFVEPKRRVSTQDLEQYFAWVPLGQLEPGSYTLELLDSANKEIRLLRRVTIPGTK